MIYRDRAGTTVAELVADRGRTLITIVQNDDFFDAAMEDVSGRRSWSADSVLVINPDSMCPDPEGGTMVINPDSMMPDAGRTGSNPTPHP